MSMIEKIRNFNFFRLFVARGARRLLPLCSVFMILLFVALVPVVPSSALVSSIAVPVNPFSLPALLPQYEGLTDDQKDIANFVAGSYGTSYSGYAGYQYQGSWSDAAHDLSSQITQFGKQMFNTLINDRPVDNMTGIPRLSILQMFSLAVIYAQSQTSGFDVWYENNIYDGVNDRQLYIEVPEAANQGMMDFFSPGSGLYSWQTSVVPWDSGFSYQHRTLSGTLSVEFQSSLSEISMPRQLVNSTWFSDSQYWGVGNLVIGPSFQFDLFINTSNHTLNCEFDSAPVFDVVGVRYDYNQVVTDHVDTSIIPFSSLSTTYDPSAYSSYSDLANSVISSNNRLFTLYKSNWFNAGISFTMQFPYAALIRDVFVGSSRDTAVPIQNIDDLYFDDTYERTAIDDPYIPVLLDIAGMVRDLIDYLAGTPDAVQGKTIEDVVIDNTVTKEEERPLTRADLQTLAVQVTLPSSGIVVPSGIFSNLTKYITYLWNFTQPLVSFTRDLLTSFEFADNKGLAWIIYGTISVGLIGGMVSKFLL